MHPADLSGPGTDEDEEDDWEILFVPRMEREEEPPPVPNTVQAAPDCEIINIASVSQDTERIRRAYDQLPGLSVSFNCTSHVLP